MRKSIILLLLMCSMQQSCSSNNEAETETQENLFFKDDFDSFNENIWTKEVHEAGWVNQELQAYDAAHVSVGIDEGKSVLILTAERKGNKIVSGRVNSKGKKSFKYKKIEASIKLPKTANGLWPAFWMMGDNEKPWPQCGEIDIMEMGERNGISSGTAETFMNTAIHYGTDSQTGHFQKYHSANVPHSLQDGKYHTYTLDWNENSLTIIIDNIKFHSFDISKSSESYEYFHDNFYILFNLAVGGAFTGITDINKITALKDGEKVNMYIDWVKIY
uniref:glycoside hydrolase family 16 protein n=1 Tax=uncultured Dysgonomonas sp. TaxID=206096 RepID=UPI002636A806|nr:glycoside hydrolase family 16 protein [uncultured Dysgonomonas sp.]